MTFLSNKSFILDKFVCVVKPSKSVVNNTINIVSKLGTFTKSFISRLLVPVFVCSITACGGMPVKTCHMQCISGGQLEVWQNTKAIFHLVML